jgi:glyoxylase I family protein
MKFRHIGLVVKDYKKSLEFWTQNFGFKISSDKLEKGKIISKVLGLNKCVVRSVKLIDKSNKLFLELLLFKNPENKKKNKIEVNSNGLTHFALTVKNLDKIYKRLKKKD